MQVQFFISRIFFQVLKNHQTEEEGQDSGYYTRVSELFIVLSPRKRVVHKQGFCFEIITKFKFLLEFFFPSLDCSNKNIHKKRINFKVVRVIISY